MNFLLHFIFLREIIDLQHVSLLKHVIRMNVNSVLYGGGPILLPPGLGHGPQPTEQALQSIEHFLLGCGPILGSANIYPRIEEGRP